MLAMIKNYWTYLLQAILRGIKGICLQNDALACMRTLQCIHAGGGGAIKRL
jgi:hypothetical protein